MLIWLYIKHELDDVTLLALGMSMSDLIASVVVTQHGMAGAVMSNMLGLAQDCLVRFWSWVYPVFLF